jgi:predicted AAA+ superfamily ATPase
VGKTTLARQAAGSLGIPGHYATADEPALKDTVWIAQQWEVARALCRAGGRRRKSLLILDEVQKIPGWSETVKRLWDEDTSARLPLQVLTLGSSALLVHQGLTESLAGRFEVLHVTHWSFTEMEAAFRLDAERFVFYGGYPGAAPLMGDHDRWTRYILDSLIETTISRDILLLRRVDKPALLRRLFEVACVHSGQILSYQKMLGQLQDAGNTTTLAHYLDLLRSAGLVAGLRKYAGRKVRQRASSPKLLVLNTALMTALSGRTRAETRADPESWGRLVETAVGAAIVNGLQGSRAEVFYWSGRDLEVDFIVEKGDSLVAIEVKSGRRRGSLRGIETFARGFRVGKVLLVGGDGIPLEEFLRMPPDEILRT